MKLFPIKKYNNIKDFRDDYFQNLFKTLNKVDINELKKISNLILKTIKNKKKILICGNGGSASLANHMLCDFAKTLKENTKLIPKIISLSSNLELITAISNDMSYNKIFSYQAENLCEKNDVVIFFSSSGNSKNLIELFKLAKKKKCKTISFVGFNGGFLKKKCDLTLNFTIDNYGISEDCNQIMMHLIMQYLKQSQLEKKKLKKNIF